VSGRLPAWGGALVLVAGGGELAQLVVPVGFELVGDEPVGRVHGEGDQLTRPLEAFGLLRRVDRHRSVVVRSLLQQEDGCRFGRAITWLGRRAPTDELRL
jgi:hypothetical protein